MTKAYTPTSICMSAANVEFTIFKSFHPFFSDPPFLEKYV